MSLRCPSCSASNPDEGRFCTQCATPLPQDRARQAAPAVAPFHARGPFSLGKYHVQHVLGQGAMGVVYAALDTYIGRQVALKTIRLEMAVTDAREQSLSRRLAREARAAGRLLHPNVTLVYEAGELGGLNYIAMELVEGGTLAQLLEESGPLPRLRAIGIALQIARALGYAHETQIIHRDIKPSNVLLAPGDLVKVTDFGLAKVLWESASLTRDGGAVGTPAYMSPEQIAGKADDGRSDLFSLAAVLYQCLSGTPPFQAKNVPALMYQILEGTHQPLELSDPDLCQAYAAFFGQALAKDPGRRYQNAEELAAALGELAALEAKAGPETAPRIPRARAAVRMPEDEAATMELGSTFEPAVPLFEPGRRERRTAPRRSLAVLGFGNLSGLPEVAWISTALCEMLGAELAAAERLHLAPAASVARMRLELGLELEDRPRKEALRCVRRNLGCELVVLGSFLALGDKARGQLRVDLHLRSASTGRTLASMSRTGTESELADVARRLASDLREALKLGELPPAEAEALRALLPARLEALRWHCEGLTRLRGLDAQAACEALRRAAAADSGHPAPHAALAEAWRLLGHAGRARDEARRAFELSSHLPRAEALRIETDYRRASREWDKAEALCRELWEAGVDPLEDGLRLAGVQIEAGRPREALSTLSAVRRLQQPADEDERPDPRLDVAEARAAGAMGDRERQRTAAARATELAGEQGTKLVAAEARLAEAQALHGGGELERAIAAAGEAKRLCAAAGDRRGAALALEQVAAWLFEQQNLSAAKRSHEELLTLARDIGERSVQGRALAGLGRNLQWQGDLQGARKRLAEGLAIFRELDEAAGMTSTLAALADTWWQQGDLAAARKSCEEALVIAREGGERRACAAELYTLGRILLARGSLAESRRRLREALTLYNELEAPQGAARTRVLLAELELEECRALEAEVDARGAVAMFRTYRLPADECWAQTVLAQSLLAQGRQAEALAAAESAMDGVQLGTDRFLALGTRIASVRIRAAAAGSAWEGEAAAGLESALAAATKAGYVGLQLEARLALGHLDLHAGRPAAGRARLEALRKEAAARGYGLVARKAAAALPLVSTRGS
jgi:eukaryotic-like serine/threonine-protein kinase